MCIVKAAQIAQLVAHYLMGLGPNPKKSPRIAESRFRYLISNVNKIPKRRPLEITNTKV